MPEPIPAAALYRAYRFPPEIISYAVWLYLRFSLSLRDVEELLAERGVAVTYETIGQWVRRFGPVFAGELRRRGRRPGDKLHLDEVALKINGRRHWLWRAVDQHGFVVDILGYDFSHIRVLADVGGGHGVLLAAILAANPSVRGILFDQPHVLMDADAISNSSGAGDRLQIVSGDFFEQLPIQADAYMLKSVIHDWDDAAAIRILRSCRAAMAEGAKLLVIEQVVLPANEPDPTKFLDVRMLVMQGGCERTADEFRQIYAAAGLELSKIIPTRSPLSIIEGSAA